jgi:serine O-acetyltransferase
VEKIIMIDDIKRDLIFFSKKLYSPNSKLTFKVFLKGVFSPEFKLIFWFRVYSSFYKSRAKWLGFFLYQHVKLKYSSDIHPMASIGVPFKVGHHMGIVIGPRVIIGSNCYFFNNVTVGNKNVGGDDEMPSIGNNVILGAGARVLGLIYVGDNCVIGANSTLISNTLPGEVWVGSPAKLAKNDLV